MNKFAIIVESKEAISGYNHTVMTKAGDKFLVTKDHEGWVEASSTRWNGEIEDPKLFPSRASAESFAKRWKGHPWWCKPNGNFEILEVKPVYTQVLRGYEVTE